LPENSNGYCRFRFKQNSDFARQTQSALLVPPAWDRCNFIRVIISAETFLKAGRARSDNNSARTDQSKRELSLMMFQQKPSVVLRIIDVQTARELRLLMSAWCDLHPIADLRSIELVCREPLALIVDSKRALPGIESAEKECPLLIQFLDAARQKYPSMRRVVIADPEDLSIAVHGLHDGTIDTLLHKPFDSADVLTALRLHKGNGTQPAAASCVKC
jgi:hypothetical protein